MIGGGTTIGYSSTATERVSGKTSLGASFSGHSSINHHHISGSSAAVVTSSPLSTSRMHLVDTLRESFMNNSYEKHVSYKLYSPMIQSRVFR